MARQQGVFVKLPALEAIDLVAAAGLDFAVVDREHSQLSEAETLRLVRHARGLGLTAHVRIPAVERGEVNRLLEAGAAGIQLSTVRSVAEVRALREAMLYAPDGARSISLAHPLAGYGATSLADYLNARRSAPPLLIAQFETAESDDPLEEILAAGVDVAFVGTTDLTVDLGLDHVRTEARVAEIVAAAERTGVTLGAFGLDDPRVAYDVIGSDVALLRVALQRAAATRALPHTPPATDPGASK